MCGIIGIWNISGKPINVDELIQMNNMIRHRGPDDEGYLLVDTQNQKTSHCHGNETIEEIRIKSKYVKEKQVANLGIGFRRLSIIDLSSSGHQPMSDASGRFWIVLNGEIYNYIEIRSELMKAGYTFRSNSDTEVVLIAYMHWGKDCLVKFNGMWAFVIYDASEGKLFCSRDRFGIKPFYYYYEPGKSFIFSSEIKTILQLIKPVADPQSILELFTTSYMDHSSRTFFRDINQLIPSHFIEISQKAFSINRYYQITVKNSSLDFYGAIEEFRNTLKDAVKIRMRSDVPLGFALSGGVDSSSNIALARNIYPSYDINAFSLIFPGQGIDESFFINKVVDTLSVKQFSISPSTDELLSSLDQFMWHQEEPNNGSSYWGEFKLRELIKRSGVTVSLEGQGADEIITGYPYFIDPYLFDLLDKFQISSFFNEAKAFRYLNDKSISANLSAYIRSSIVRSKKSRVRLPDYLNLEYFPGSNSYDQRIRSAEFSKSRLNKALYHSLTRCPA